MITFSSPEAPPDQTGPVKAWRAPVLVPAYEPLPPDKNPMFLENRVYQGSSGRIYPMPFTDRIATELADRAWQAIHLENEFLRVMIVPEIGGRIHVALDKTNGYDFFYRQNVIKPALVGLAGPWISGGVEFNWPQHHRPATFLPVETHIEEHEDGSRTVWCSDHDPMNRMKGMHGVCLHPGRSYIELKVRLYNRTEFVQTFLWWANVAARAHEHYQLFFPPDVEYVADHAKRAISRFPLCEGTYYGVDYAARARDGVPAEEMPRCFVPPGSYPPNDLRWYANIPVPTSYMALGSKENFFGGYDHAEEAGFVHVANRHLSPGKKLWTWGNHEFGYAWDRNLTDADGPYVELMAGVYTDNQPDFSFLAPGETKAFSQFWYPIQKIGPVQKANLEAALSIRASETGARIGICATRAFPNARIVVKDSKGVAADWRRDLTPGAAFLEEVTVAGLTSVTVCSANGQKLISYSPLAGPNEAQPPVPAAEPLSPEEIASTDELYLTALHLEQYRHATRRPEAYWREALRRDPGDVRSNSAIGIWYLRRGEFTKAEQHLRAAISRLTQRHPNPYNGEPYFYLGVTHRYLGRDEEAYAAFYRAAWNYAWRAPAYYALAELDSKRGDWESAREHLRVSLRTNADNNGARNLLVIALRQLGLHAAAARVLRETVLADPLDQWARWLESGAEPANNQMRLDLAFDYARAGLCQDAIDVLSGGDFEVRDGSAPMLLYALAHFDNAKAAAWREKAAGTPPDYCFPSRLEEMQILEAASRANPKDARALYYLGNLLYDRRQHEEALALWKRSSELDSSFPTVWRNLGIAYFNVAKDPDKALFAFDRALAAGPQDARILYERDQLWKRTGKPPRERLRELERFQSLIGIRDDLSAEIATLHNDTSQPERALAVLTSRKFQPWEGGEGIALGQYVRTQVMLGRRALAGARFNIARHHLEWALTSPENLGEAQHLLSNRSNVYYWLGVACEAAGDHTSARHWWQRAAVSKGDFQQMSVRSFSEMSYYSGRALKRLGASEQAEQLFRDLLRYAQQLARQEATVDYFATSLPHLLLFDEDLNRTNAIASKFLEAQARIGLSEAGGERLLEEVLAADPNHQMALDFQDEIRCEHILQGAG
ncbi:MAG TPA: DUF5107 domain-containing protein [Bryobacteraceae bacterium]